MDSKTHGRYTDRPDPVLGSAGATHEKVLAERDPTPAEGPNDGDGDGHRIDALPRAEEGRIQGLAQSVDGGESPIAATREALDRPLTPAERGHRPAEEPEPEPDGG